MAKKQSFDKKSFFDIKSKKKILVLFPDEGEAYVSHEVLKNLVVLVPPKKIQKNIKSKNPASKLKMKELLIKWGFSDFGF